METRFVKPFAAPQMVVRQQTGESLGVFDGARAFGTGYYALLKDGIVKLYDYRKQQIYGDLEDAWVTPNGYHLIREKGSAKWKLFLSPGKCRAEGDRAVVFAANGTALVFLKQSGVPEWRYFDVSKHSVAPKANCISADEIDVRQQRNKLYFILTSGEKNVLQYRTMFTLKLEGELSDVPYYAFLPDGSIAVAEKPLSCIEGPEFLHVTPSEGSVMTVYTGLKFRFRSDGIVMTSSGVYLQRCGEEWSLFAGGRLVKDGIFNVVSYGTFMSCGRDTVGRTADGRPVVLQACSPEDVMLDYAGEIFHILKGKKVICAGMGKGIVFI